ncbi:MAG TPA: tetratricopeptide repeat protein [Usitatibacter sp.]|nr:tetratricopeptide repeat protein [Usitatibacter sp.]
MKALLRRDMLWLPLVLAAVLVIYLPGLDNGLVFDDGYLADGELFRDYRSTLEFRARMLSYGSFVWLQALFGEGWWKQRLFNVLLHIGVVLSLWALYREILRHITHPAHADDPGVHPDYENSPALGFAIGFFALNPVAVYGVAYLIQRSIVMATLFVVIGLWALARGLRLGKPAWFIAALAAYALAVMSKEYAILAPLAGLPIYILVKRPSAKQLAIVWAGGSLLVGAAAYGLWHRYGEILGKPFDEYSRVYLQQLARLDPGAEKHSFSLSILNEAYLFFHYGLRWVFPVAEWLSINLRPPFPLTWTSFPQVLGIFGYVGVVIGGFYLLLRYRDWRALLGISLLLPALLYPTEFSTVWVQDPFVLYRSYLWAIGIPGLVFFILHGPSARVVAIIGLIAATFLTWQSLDRVISLSTSESAWSDAIAKLPSDPRAVGRWFAYLNRGNAYVESNEFKLAMRDFERSAQLGDMGMGTFNTGALLAAAGRHAQALAAFDQAERMGYNLYNLPFQRGLSLQALNRPEEAAQQFGIAWNLNPPSPTRELLLLNIGRNAMQRGKPSEAVHALQLLLEKQPENREARQMLAMSLIMSNQHDSARALLDEMIGSKPSGAAYYARALANYGLKRKNEALSDIDNAIRLGPANANMQQWRAKILAMP